MKILADENIEREFIEALRLAKIDVTSIWESYIGITDHEILQIAISLKAIILTYDTDFGELVFRFGLESQGIILLRLSGLSLPDKVDKTVSVIQEHESELENSFTVISESSVRIRRAF